MDNYFDMSMMNDKNMAQCVFCINVAMHAACFYSKLFLIYLSNTLIAGLSSEELKKKMELMKAQELDHEKGQIFAYTYTLNDDHYALQKDVFDLFTGERKAFVYIYYRLEEITN
jgi:hypothetical protein